MPANSSANPAANPGATPTRASRSAALWGAALLAPLFLWSLVHPTDSLTWFLESVPVIVTVPLLAFTFRRFPLTPLAYSLIALHAAVLLVGGHYTYAEVPLFNWLRDAFGFARNHYDRLGHFMQGAVPAILAREVLLRRSPLKNGKWLFFLVTCVCLAISAGYELVEWLSAVLLGQGADAFLGTQGDPWDTQWDMFMCLVGALSSQLALGCWHNRQIVRLGGVGAAGEGVVG